jgi:hypothetical protein
LPEAEFSQRYLQAIKFRSQSLMGLMGGLPITLATNLLQGNRRLKGLSIGKVGNCPLEGMCGAGKLRRIPLLDCSAQGYHTHGVFAAKGVDKDRAKLGASVCAGNK